MVVMGIGIGLWFLGIFDTTVTPGVTSSGFIKLKPLNPSVVITEGGEFTGTFVNGAGGNIVITTLSIFNVNDVKYCDSIVEGVGNVEADDAFFITGSGGFSSLPPKVREPYTFQVNSSYTAQVAGFPVNKKEDGTLYGVSLGEIITTTTSSTSTSTSSTTTAPTCSGTPTSCSSFSDQSSCNGQSGCSWNPSSCSGTCTPCGSLSLFDCLNQLGCFVHCSPEPDCWCDGTCTPCSSLSNETSCNGQYGCSWNPGSCSGTPTSCSSFTDEASCIAQQGCSWG